MTSAATKPVVLEARGIRKTFGHVQALRGASMSVHEGAVTAIVGDNGAGKSTLIRCLSGTYKPDGGDFLLDGSPVSITCVADARRLGIETVYQDLALVDDLTVAQNLFLNREEVRRLGPLRFVDRRRMSKRTQALLAELRIDVPSIDAKVRELSGGQRQGIAIARGVYWAKRIMVLDEPTAALGVRETARVEETIANLVERGTTVVMITHSVEQVMRLAAYVWVMRVGTVVGGVETASTTKNEIVSLITGASPGEVARTDTSNGKDK